MNVLAVIDKLSLDGRSPSCIALHLRDAAPFFARQGCTVSVCNLRSDDPGAALLKRAGLPTIETGTGPLSTRTLPALMHVVRRQRPDVIHAHGYAAANFGRIAGRLSRVPVVVHEHAVLRVRPHQYLCDFLLRHWTARGIAISAAVERFMVRGRCVPPAKVTVIPNGIDVERFKTAARMSRGVARARFGWPGDALAIGSAARFRHEKGLHVLLDAVIPLVGQHADVIGVLAGDGPDRAGFQQRVAGLGLSDRILFPGFVEDMPTFLRALNVLAIPSLQEGLSFVALEAMATETAVVASRVGGLPEIVDHDVNGVLVPPGDENSLGTAIDALMRDPERQRRLVAAGARTVEHYGMERYVARMLAVYRDVTGAASG